MVEMIIDVGNRLSELIRDLTLSTLGTQKSKFVNLLFEGNGNRCS